MIKKIIPAFIALVVFASCQSKTAFKYSENFVKKEESLMAQMDATEAAVSNFVNTGQLDSIAVVGTKMEKAVDVKLQEIINEPAPDVKGGVEFKKACVTYFEYIKSMYTEYRKFGSAKTQEEQQAVLTKIQKIVAEKSNIISEIQSAQAKFAKDNGFRLAKQ